MRAMILDRQAPIAEAPLRLAELPVPEPAPDELLVRVSCCAICRTDLHVIEGDLAPKRLPLVPGHQIVGRVVARGAQCSQVAVGERVGVAWLRRTCGHCRFCLTDRENLCEAPRFTGWDADGGYAEYAVVPEAFAYRIPAAFDDVAAAPLLCSGIIGYRALMRADLLPGAPLGLWGFGSSAHVVIQLARARDHQVYVVTRDAAHRRLATALGAAWVGPSGAQPPVPLGGGIVFAPVGSIVPEALAALDRGATLALAGIHMTDVPPLRYEQHLFYEKRLQSVTANTRADGQALLAEAAARQLRPRTTVYQLEQANVALQDLAADRISGSGVLAIGSGLP